MSVSFAAEEKGEKPLEVTQEKCRVPRKSFMGGAYLGKGQKDLRREGGVKEPGGTLEIRVLELGTGTKNSVIPGYKIFS